MPLQSWAGLWLDKFRDQALCLCRFGNQLAQGICGVLQQTGADWTLAIDEAADGAFVDPEAARGCGGAAEDLDAVGKMLARIQHFGRIGHGSHFRLGRLCALRLQMEWQKSALWLIARKMEMTNDDMALSRPQRRLLRRIYNGRTVPIVADGREFLTFKDANRYLLSLGPEARDAAYAEMKLQGT